MLPEQRLQTHALTTWNIFDGVLDFHWYTEYNVGNFPLCDHWCVLGNLQIYTMVVCACVCVCVCNRCKESERPISVVAGSLLTETVIKGSMKPLGSFSPILSMVMVR